MKLILTSCLDTYTKNSEGERIPHNFGNKNGILDLIKKLAPRQKHFVYVANNENDYCATDIHATAIFNSFNLTFPFKNYTILDGRTAQNAKTMINNADLIFLCGGHVPTQNIFLHKTGIATLLKDSNALIIGVSAGSMNCADVVYSQPELPGETIDPNYHKYLKGLGLTKISILPHFTQKTNCTLDGKNIFKEISIPDSKLKPFIACLDGTFIYDNGQAQFIYGEAYFFDNGSFQKISSENQITDITDLVDEKFTQINYYNLIKI